MNKQDKIPEKQWNQVETATFQKKEFRVMIVKMILDLGEKKGKDANNVYQILRRTIAHIGVNIFKGINSRIIEVRRMNSWLEDRMMEIHCCKTILKKE